MVVCKFFQQGSCKFGARCNYEHPRHLHGSSNQSSSFNNSASFASKTVLDANQPKVKDITSDTIKTDFTTEKPQWPFTSYCPVKYGHANLLKDQDLSFEEVRASSYEALQKQAMPQYEQDLNTRINSLNATIQAMLSNVGEAVTMAQQANTPRTSGQSSNTTSQSTLFGTPQTQNAFSTTPSGFGNSSTAASVFGGSNQTPSSVFGMTAPTQSSKLSPFAQNAFNSTSPFGVPATNVPTLGANASTSSTFGTTSNPVSAFGAPSKLSSVFSAPSTSPFGSTSTTNSSFGNSSFGNTNATPSAFGAATTQNPFGGQAAPVSASGSAQTSTPSFGASGFGTTTSPVSVFGGAAQSQRSAFSAPKDAGQSASVFGQPQSASAFGSLPASSNVPTATTTTDTSVTGPFGSQNSTSTVNNANPFAAVSKGTFGDQAVSTTQTWNLSSSGSAFGQSNVRSVFGQPGTSASGQNTSTQTVFGHSSAPQSAFGQTSAPQSAFGQASTPHSAFSQSKQNSVFGSQPNVQSDPTSHNAVATTPQSMAQTTSVFGQPRISQPNSSAFNVQTPASAAPNVLAQSNPISDPPPQTADSASGELDIAQLPEELLAKFNAEGFTVGEIPEIAPPSVLCR